MREVLFEINGESYEAVVDESAVLRSARPIVDRQRTIGGVPVDDINAALAWRAQESVAQRER